MRSYRAIPVVLLFVIGAMLLSGPAIAADFPTKPITLICPYPGGRVHRRHHPAAGGGRR